MNPSHNDAEIFPRRLKLARERAGLTLRDLEEATGKMISFTTLANYEAGRHFPDENILVRLAKELHVAPDWLFRPFTVELSGFHFRKDRTFGAKEQKALISRATDFFELYHEIEEITGSVRRSNKAELPKIKVRSLEDAERYAHDLRDSWGLGLDPLPSVIELIEEKGIKLFQTSMSAKIDGMQAVTSAGPVIVLNCTTGGVEVSIPRERLTTVHELGHALLEIPSDATDDEHEKIAWRFAEAFLLPKDPFISAFGTGRKKISLDELLQLKFMFGASMWAIMRRAWVLSLISRASYDRFSAHAAKAGWKTSKGEPGDDRFPVRQKNARFAALVRRAESEGAISKHRAEEMLEAAGLEDAPKSKAVF